MSSNEKKTAWDTLSPLSSKGGNIFSKSPYQGEESIVARERGAPASIFRQGPTMREEKVNPKQDYTDDELQDMSKEELMELTKSMMKNYKSSEPSESQLLLRPTPSNDSSESHSSFLERGGFGWVERRTGKRDKRQIAVKKIVLRMLHSDVNVEGAESSYPTILREIKLVGTLPIHVNLVTYFGSDVSVCNGQIIYEIKMEYCGEGTLREYLAPLDCPEQEPAIRARRFVQSMELFRDCIEALFILHEHKVMHRDLKPSNVMLAFDAYNVIRAKLGDFGLSCAFHQLPSKGGTFFFSSPEQWNYTSHGPKSDIFSLGRVLLAVVFDTHETGILQRRAEDFRGYKKHWNFEGMQPCLSAELKGDLFKFIQDMCNEDSSDRPTINDIRNDFSSFLVALHNDDGDDDYD